MKEQNRDPDPPNKVALAKTVGQAADKRASDLRQNGAVKTCFSVKI